MVLSYIKYHIRSLVMICFIYGVLFSFQLILVGEAIYENGFDHSRIEDTTYTYVLSNIEYNKIDMIIADNTLNYSDICVVSHNGLYDIVSYPNGLDERRLGYRKNVTSKEDGIIDLNEGISSESLFRAENVDGQLVHLIPRDDGMECNIYEVGRKIIIGDKEYNKGQYITIKNTYTEELPPSQLYCTYRTFKDIAPKGTAMISLAFQKPLNKVELDRVNEKINRACEAEYKARKAVIDNDSRKLVNDIGFVAIMIIIAALCFSSLMISTLSERDEEYHILHLCGATGSKVETERLKHVMVIMLFSICFGLIVFWTSRSCINGFIDYKNDDYLFYAGNILGFVFITAITMLLSRIAKRSSRRNVYSSK